MVSYAARRRAAAARRYRRCYATGSYTWAGVLGGLPAPAPLLRPAPYFFRTARVRYKYGGLLCALRPLFLRRTRWLRLSPFSPSVPGWALARALRSGK